MAENVWDIVVGVQNKQELDELNRAIEQGEKKILAYKAAMDAGKITQEMYVGSARSVAMSIEQASGRIQEITGHAENLGKAGAKAGYGLLQVGYAIDDVQYGFKSIVNNIPQIAMGLGAGTGVAGVAAIAAVAVNQLVNHWGELVSAFDGGATLRESAAMKELADHTEEAVKGYEKLAAMRTGPGEKAVGATEAAVVNIGAEAIAQGVAAGFEKEVTIKFFREEAVGDQGETRRIELKPGTPEHAVELERVRKDMLKDAQATVKDMAKNPAARERVMGLVQANPGDFPPGTFTKLEEASPERQAEKMAAAKKAKEWEGERKATDEHDKAKAAQAKKIGDDIRERAAAKRAGDNKLAAGLTEQGAELEKAMWAEKAKEAHDLEVKKDALEKRQHAIQEKIHDRPHFSTFSGVGDMIKSMQEDMFNKVPTQQLNELKGIKKGIEDLNDQIKNVRGAKFG